MSSLFSRRDVVVVASVSCIYGIGSKEDYEALVHPDARRAGNCRANNSLSRLVDLQYDAQRHRVRARAISACAATRWKSVPAGREDGLRDRIFRRRNRTHHALRAVDRAAKSKRSRRSSIFPAKQFVTTGRQDEARDPDHPRGTGRPHRLVRDATANCSKRSASRCARNSIWK